MWYSFASLTAIYAQSAYASLTDASRSMGWGWGQSCLQYEGQRNWGPIPFTSIDGADMFSNDKKHCSWDSANQYWLGESLTPCTVGTRLLR